MSTTPEPSTTDQELMGLRVVFLALKRFLSITKFVDFLPKRHQNGVVNAWQELQNTVQQHEENMRQ